MLGFDLAKIVIVGRLWLVYRNWQPFRRLIVHPRPYSFLPCRLLRNFVSSYSRLNGWYCK